MIDGSVVSGATVVFVVLVVFVVFVVFAALPRLEEW